MLYQVLLILVPVVTTPYVSRVLSPSNIGEYNYVNSIVTFIALCCNLGSSVYAQREIAYHQTDLYKRSSIFWEILSFRILMCILITPVYFSIAYSSSNFKITFFIQYLFIINDVIDISWYYQGLENFRITAIRGGLVKIISAICIFLFVKNSKDFYLYVMILSMSMPLSTLYLWKYLHNNIKFVNFKDIHPFRHIKMILVLFLPIAAINIYTTLDKVFLGFLTSPREVGYYSQTERIVKLAMTVVTSLGTVMLPTVAKLINENNYNAVRDIVKKSIKFVLYLSLPMMFGLVVCAPKFIPWFLGIKYFDAIPMLQLFAPLIIIISLSSVTGQAVLLPLKKERIYTISIFIGGFSNIVLNSILIPVISSYGAIISTIIAELIVGSIQQVTVLRCLNLRIRDIIIDNYKCLISSISMGIVIILLTKYIGDGFMGLITLIIVGVIIYIISLLFLKDKILLTFINNFIKKINH